jgi:hypothetical protein
MQLRMRDIVIGCLPVPAVFFNIISETVRPPPPPKKKQELLNIKCTFRCSYSFCLKHFSFQDNWARWTKYVYSSKFFHSPNDARVHCLTNSVKNYVKIDIKATPTCFGAVTPSSGSALLVLAKVTVVKIANCNTSVCGDVAAATSPHTDVS